MKFKLKKKVTHSCIQVPAQYRGSILKYGDFLVGNHVRSSCLIIFQVEIPNLKVSGPARLLFFKNLGEIATSAGAILG